MGQAHSTPTTTHNNNVAAARAQSPPTVPKTSTDGVRIPSAWKNDADFMLISPVSDISNPSQFRGRQQRYNNHATAAGTTQKAAAAVATAVPSTNNNTDIPVSSIRRSRTSKVCPRQPPPLSALAGGANNHPRSHLPPPTRFYFSTTPNRRDAQEEENEASEERYQQQQQLQQREEANEKQHGERAYEKHDERETPAAANSAEAVVVGTAPGTSPAKKRSLAATWKAKCAKAKQQLGECWSDNKGNVEEEPEPRMTRHFSQRNLPPKYPEQGPYLQLEGFEPVWKEQNEDLDGINNFPKLKESSTQTSPTEKKDSPNITPCVNQRTESIVIPATLDQMNLEGRARLPSITYTTDTEEETSRVEARALSLNSYSRRSRTSIQSTSTKETTDTTTVLQEKQCRIPVAKPKMSRESISTVDSKSTQSSLTTVLQPVIDKNNVFRKAPTYNTKQAELLSTENRPRASIGRVSSSASGTATVKDGKQSLDDGLRTRIQEEVQRQIDAQTTSRVQRLRQQYQQEIEKMKVVPPKVNAPPVAPAAGTSIAATKRSDRFSIPTETFTTDGLQSQQRISTNPNMISHVSVAEKRRAFEPRAASVPARRKSEGTHDKSTARTSTVGTSRTTAASSRRRSVSVPRGRPSIDGSALLHMTGQWKSQIVLPQPAQPQLPVLLQMAGWDKENKKSSNKRSSLSKSSLSKTTTEPSASVKQRPEVSIVQKPKHSTKSTDRLSTESEPAPTVSKVAQPQRKVGSYDLPRREPPVRKGRTIAMMLQQAYFQDEDDDDSEKTSSTQSAKPNYLALAYPSPAFLNKNAMVESSPALSVDSASSAPLVSEQALLNADFLFASDAQLTAIPHSRLSLSSLPGAGCSITTWNSQSRILQTAAGQPAPIPPSLSNDTLDTASQGSGRRVRFSEDSSFEKTQISHPMIESKLSDLTDTTSRVVPIIAPTESAHEYSDASTATTLTIPRIDSIPEEDEDDGSRLHISMISTERDMIFEDEQEEMTPPKPPIMRWSYRTEGELMQGVTPLLSNRTSTNIITNSPYLRFQEAKGKFTGRKSSVGTAATIKKKESPVKRSSPVKQRGGNIVSSRVTAMESRRAQSEGGETSKALRSQKKRRVTSGYENLALRSGNRSSPSVKSNQNVALVERNADSIEEVKTPYVADSPFQKDEMTQSPTFVDGEVVESAPQRQVYLSMNDSGMASVDSAETEDAFGAILHPNTIDEDSVDDRFGTGVADNSTVVNDSQSDDDAFDLLLKYDESDDENSRQQLSNYVTADDKTGLVSLSSCGDSSSMPSWLKSRASIESNEDYSIVSAVGRMKGALPFRDVAPVKPNEQNPRIAPGTNNIRPNLEQPKTWRALAAAAYEKKQNHRVNPAGRRSLLERNVNTFGR